MTSKIYLNGKKGRKFIDGRLRIIEPVGILGEDFNLGYFDHSTLKVIKDVNGEIISEIPDLCELPTNRPRGYYDNNIFVVHRGIQILEKLLELRENTLYATYLLAYESDSRFKFKVDFGKRYQPGRDEIERLRKLLGNELISQIFSSIPNNLEDLVKVLFENKIPFDTDSLREVVESRILQVGDYIKAALAR